MLNRRPRRSHPALLPRQNNNGSHQKTTKKNDSSFDADLPSYWAASRSLATIRSSPWQILLRIFPLIAHYFSV